MAVNYQDIELAFYFVSGAPQFQNSAWVSRSTRRIFYASVIGDNDELPDDLEESDDYITIPHKNELDLGKALVMEFVELHCPERSDEVRFIFSRPGAYSRYKNPFRTKACWTRGMHLKTRRQKRLC